MLRKRIQKRTAMLERTARRFAEIRSSITALADDDLLDLADIFSKQTTTPLWEIASTEMAKRNLRL
jgi:hypothetical protein